MALADCVVVGVGGNEGGEPEVIGSHTQANLQKSFIFTFTSTFRDTFKYTYGFNCGFELSLLAVGPPRVWARSAPPSSSVFSYLSKEAAASRQPRYRWSSGA